MTKLLFPGKKATIFVLVKVSELHGTRYRLGRTDLTHKGTYVGMEDNTVSSLLHFIE